ncbi:MAG: hypothetical protein KUG69_11255 [Marinosulfonomonas sp.]|nr:hypothetical protein [Marinosulfonomonas sp.]
MMRQVRANYQSSRQMALSKYRTGKARNLFRALIIVDNIAISDVNKATHFSQSEKMAVHILFKAIASV